MVTIKLYVEGGGDSNDLRTRCRRGFAELLRKVGLEGRMPRIVACGSRGNAYQDFRTAISQAGADEFPVLLVDSEAPVGEVSNSWDHLRTKDGWDRPAHAAEEHAHLMVQCMEAWFLSDKDCLAVFYGQGFYANALPQRSDIENLPKADVFDALRNATRHTRTKGEYRKGTHSFDLLARIDPERVRGASPHADRFFATLIRKADERP